MPADEVRQLANKLERYCKDNPVLPREGMGPVKRTGRGLSFAVDTDVYFLRVLRLMAANGEAHVRSFLSHWDR